MKEDSFKPTIVLGTLEGNDSFALNPLQLVITEHIDGIIVLWWLLWVSTLLYLISRYLIRPWLLLYLHNNKV